jgi:flagella basal body P-ring formation protein FlgA
MVEVKDLAAAGQPLAHTLTSPDGIIDMEATRDLRAGDALRASDVRPAVLVRKGDLVTLTAARTTGLTIRARVEALQDGRRGESIKIKNKESGQVLTGVVSGLNSVEAL